ncbi:hypothetical protein [Alteromonas sp. CyTr2]|uniref:hypothetical protein n=1 Tax=Alteromonas sp. CyTr2 TaxID=2935039 RepID=UPI00248F2104|nr:hypothetical protein [Alteromonas sp. CyTr2]
MESNKIKKSEKEILLEKEKETRAFATGIIGALSLIGLFFGPQLLSEFDATRQYQLVPIYVGLLGMMLFIGMSFENSDTFQFLWKYKSMKLFSTVAISYTLIISGSKAASVINEVFNVDGSYLPYTMALLTPVTFILTLKWVFFCISAWSILVLIGVTTEYKYSKVIKWNSICFIVSSLLLSGFLYFQSEKSFGNDGLKIKAYKLGHQFDFSSTFDCASLENNKKDQAKISVLFLTPDHNQVISDKKLSLNESFQDFFSDTDMSNYEKIGNFKRSRCSEY